MDKSKEEVNQGRPVSTASHGIFVEYRMDAVDVAFQRVFSALINYQLRLDTASDHLSTKQQRMGFALFALVVKTNSLLGQLLI